MSKVLLATRVCIVHLFYIITSSCELVHAFLAFWHTACNIAALPHPPASCTPRAPQFLIYLLLVISLAITEQDGKAHKCKMGSALAKELRAPTQKTCLGWMAQRIMSMGNGSDSIDAVSQIDSAIEKPVVVEIGPGAGYSLREIFKKLSPSRVYGIEISDAFRDQIAADKEFGASIEGGVLSLHGGDAKDLNFIPDSSVDIVFAFNVIYFLNPLSIYLKELNRILKPGGSVNFGVKTVAKAMDQSVYINTDWGACLDEIKSAGFVEVEAKEERLEGPLAYTALVGKKPN